MDFIVVSKDLSVFGKGVFLVLRLRHYLVEQLLIFVPELLAVTHIFVHKEPGAELVVGALELRQCVILALVLLEGFHVGCKFTKLGVLQKTLPHHLSHTKLARV